MSVTHLNLRGLKCPLPALKTRKALTGVEPGTVLIVECTDPLAAIDIPNLLNETGDVLETQSTHEGVLVFHIRRAAAVGSQRQQSGR
jgi:tRNA 2-thiouridine synthesizing protein A